jgi:hypothetical protein
MTSKLAHIRPCTPVEMLDRAFWVFCLRPRLFVACACAAALPGLFGLFAADRSGETALPPAALGAAYFLLYLVSELADACATAGAFQMSLHPERPLLISALVRSAFARLPLYILTRLMLFLPIIWFGMAMPLTLWISGKRTSETWFAAMLAAAGVLLAIRLFYHWVLAPSVVLIEKRGLFAALMRSMVLMRWPYRSPIRGDGSALRLAMIALPVATAMTALTGLGLAVGLHFDGPEFLHGWPRSNGRPLFVASAALGMATAIWWPSVAVLYMENLMRREALDVHVRLLEHEDND